MLIDKTRLALNDKRDMKIELLRIGEDKNPVLVVDNFYKDPEYVRELALNLDYRPPPENDFYPGRQASIGLDRSAIDYFVTEQLTAPTYGIHPDMFRFLPSIPGQPSGEWVRFFNGWH